jgi:hypothetical protein
MRHRAGVTASAEAVASFQANRYIAKGNLLSPTKLAAMVIELARMTGGEHRNM